MKKKTDKILTIILVALLLIASCFAIVTAIHANAQSVEECQTEYLTDLVAKYNKINGNLTLTEGNAYLDYAYGLTKDRIKESQDAVETESYYQDAVGVFETLSYAEKTAKEIVAEYDKYLLNSDNYGQSELVDLGKIKDNAIDDIKIKKVIKNDTFEKGYFDEVKEKALFDMSTVPTKHANLDKEKKAFEDYLSEYAFKYQMTGLYSDYGNDEIDKLLLEYVEKIYKAGSIPELVRIKDDFIGVIKSVKTIISEANDIYSPAVSSYYLTEEEKKELIEKAFNAYLSAQNSDRYSSSMFKGIDSDLFNLKLTYHKCLNNLIDAKEKLTNKYSKANVKKIHELERRYKAKLNEIDLESGSTTVQKIQKMKNEYTSFEYEFRDIPENVNVIRYYGEQFTITVTSTDRYAFDVTDTLCISDYRFSAVRKSVNDLLKKGEYDGIRVLYYYTLFVKTSENRMVDDFDEYASYTVEITTDNLEKLTKFPDNVHVVYYEGNRKISDLFAQKEDAKLTFDMNSLGSFAICGKDDSANAVNVILFKLGFLDNDLINNPFTYIACVLAIILLILLIKLLIRTKQYKLVFETFGGSKVAPERAHRHEYFKTPKNPVKDGHYFGGWYKEAYYKNRFTDFYCEKRRTVKVYAKWVQKSVYAESLPDYYRAIKASVLTYVQPDVYNSYRKGKEKLMVRVNLYSDRVSLYLSGRATKALKKLYEVQTVRDREFGRKAMLLEVGSDVTFRQALSLIKDVLTSYGYTKGNYKPNGVNEITDEENFYGFRYYFSTNFDRFKERAFKEIRNIVRAYSPSNDDLAKLLNGKNIVKVYNREDAVYLYLPTVEFGDYIQRTTQMDKCDLPTFIGILNEKTLSVAKEKLYESLWRTGLYYDKRNDVKKKTESTCFAYKINVEYKKEKEVKPKKEKRVKQKKVKADNK